MAKYRLLSGNHGRFEGKTPVQYVAGQVMELSKVEAEGASLKGRIEPVAEGADDSVDLSLMNATKAISLINKLETVEEVVEFQSAEAEGKNRPTVIKAATARLEELASQ